MSYRSDFMIAEVAALQAESTALLTEIRDLSVRVSGILPLIQEFRVSVATATTLSPPRPSNMTDHILTGSGGFTSSSRSVHIPK
jgi:hypothetical protein